MNANATPTITNSAANGAPAGLIDWHDVHTGGMPAFERALRVLEAGYLELTDRLAVEQANRTGIRGGDLSDQARADLFVAALCGEES